MAKHDRCSGPSHSEQMSAIEARTDAEAGEAPAVGGKRKAGGKGAAGARKKSPGAGALNTHVRPRWGLTTVHKSVFPITLSGCQCFVRAIARIHKSTKKLV